MSRMRVGDEWMPVAHADVAPAAACRPLPAVAAALCLLARELGDRRDAAEQLVVMRDLLDPRGRHLAATQTLARNGRMSSIPSGPPKEIRRTASNALIFL